MILITKTIKIELIDEERLIFACADGDLEEAKRLLSTGQDVNTTDQRGHSILWLACYRNQTEVVKLLLRYTNLNENKNELSRDMTAIFKKHNNATTLFISKYQGLYFYFCILFLPLRFSLFLNVFCVCVCLCVCFNEINTDKS